MIIIIYYDNINKIKRMLKRVSTFKKKKLFKIN